MPRRCPHSPGSSSEGACWHAAGDAAIAARVQYGQGTVAVVGLDPATPWLLETAGGGANPFWAGVFTSTAAPLEPLRSTDEGFISDALANIPAVQLPPFDLLVLLLVGYVVAVGPLNYLVLRRRDRREWAWLTMPATILVFAIGAYGIGVFMKGGDAVVNQLAVVHGATGTDRGLAQVYVGVYSPSRAEFDVRVGGDALLSVPTATSQFGGFQPSDVPDRPVDALLGDPATLRRYGIGFGSLRAFRAQASMATPLIAADLRLNADALQGTVTNSSDVTLSDVSLVYGNSIQVLGEMGPGASVPVDLTTRSNVGFDLIWERLYPQTSADDPATLRRLAARRALLQHLSGGWEADFRGSSTNSLFATGPVVLAWQSGATLDVDLGSPAEQVGERVYVLRTRAEVSGPVVFSGGLLQHAGVDFDGLDAGESGGLFVLTRGTIAADYWPLGFDGSFAVSRLSLRMSSGPAGEPSVTADDLAPLPAEEQPDSDDPLASNPEPGSANGLPRLQLFDRGSGTWVEFEPLTSSRSYDIPDPVRYVDGTGAIHVRFVVRDLDDYVEFALGVRLEGTVE